MAHICLTAALAWHGCNFVKDSQMKRLTSTQRPSLALVLQHEVRATADYRHLDLTSSQFPRKQPFDRER